MPLFLLLCNSPFCYSVQTQFLSFKAHHGLEERIVSVGRNMAEGCWNSDSHKLTCHQGNKMSPDRLIWDDPLSYNIPRRPELFPLESSNTGTEKITRTVSVSEWCNKCVQSTFFEKFDFSQSKLFFQTKSKSTLLSLKLQISQSYLDLPFWYETCISGIFHNSIIKQWIKSIHLTFFFFESLLSEMWIWFFFLDKLGHTHNTTSNSLINWLPPQGLGEVL